MGASADLINYPFCAMIVGFVAGSCAALGFGFFNSWARKALRMHDTQGVLYGHGWAGIIGGFTSTISCALAERNFGTRYNDYFYSDADGEVREPRHQAGY